MFLIGYATCTSKFRTRIRKSIGSSMVLLSISLSAVAQVDLKISAHQALRVQVGWLVVVPVVEEVVLVVVGGISSMVHL